MYIFKWTVAIYRMKQQYKNIIKIYTYAMFDLDKSKF